MAASTTTKETPTKQKRRSAPMTDDHKAKLAKGRNLGIAVNAYLTALESAKPKRGRKVSLADLQKRWEHATEQAAASVGTAKLLATQAAADLEERMAAELHGADGSVQMDELRKGFVASAREYGEAKNIRWSTWRAAGVPAEDLRAAGIPRSAA